MENRAKIICMGATAIDPLASRAKCLIVCNQACSLEEWAPSIEELGAEVTYASAAADILQVWEGELPDLMIIEDAPAEQDTLEICRKLRAQTSIPILFLTSRQEEDFLRSAYAAGMDECILQPISQGLFLAKLHAWLRRTRRFPVSLLSKVHAGGLALDAASRQLKTGARLIRLSNLETKLLYLLMSHAGEVLEMDDLTDRVWGKYGGGSRDMLKNLIYRLRQKIEEDPANPRILVSAGRFGYQLVDDQKIVTRL